MANKAYEKMLNIMSLGKCRLKQQDTLCLLEWRKSKTLTTPNVGEDVELLLVADGMQNGRVILEGSLAFSYKTKHTLTIWSTNCIPRYLLKGVENLYPHKNLHKNV